MARFDDYHRTVIGYHGTGLSTALRIINRVEDFRWSQRNFDWLGHGIYFWEYAPQKAMDWAELRRRQLKKKRNPSTEEIKQANEPIAVVASMIRLGFCFDLLEPYNVKYLLEVFEEYRETMELAGEALPQNSKRKHRKLDCAVFEYAYKVISASPEQHAADTARCLCSNRRGSSCLGGKLDFTGYPHPAMRSKSLLYFGNMALSPNQNGGRRCPERA